MAENPQLPVQPPAQDNPQLPVQSQAPENSSNSSENKDSSPKEARHLSLQEMAELIKDGDWVTVEVGGKVVGRARVFKKA